MRSADASFLKVMTYRKDVFRNPKKESSETKRKKRQKSREKQWPEKPCYNLLPYIARGVKGAS